MAEERKSLIEDRDMLERYLVWRALDRQQRRQRRVRRAVVVAAGVGIIGVAVAAWSSYGAHLTASFGLRGSPSAGVARATNVTDATRTAGVPADVVDSQPKAAPSRPALPPPASPQITRTPTPFTPTPAAGGRTARANVPAPARIRAPEGVRTEPSREPAPPPTPGPSRAPTSDLEASAAPPDDWPAPAAEQRRAPEPHDYAATPRTVIVPWTPPSSAPAAESSRTVQSPVAVPPESAPPTTPARPGDWLKGETREFRDGVKRGVDEFRAGIDKVGRGLQWLGDKLRRSD
jgi:hypothetical protein